MLPIKRSKEWAILMGFILVRKNLLISLLLFRRLNCLFTSSETSSYWFFRLLIAYLHLQWDSFIMMYTVCERFWGYCHISGLFLVPWYIPFPSNCYVNYKTSSRNFPSKLHVFFNMPEFLFSCFISIFFRLWPLKYFLGSILLGILEKLGQ